MIIAGNLTFAKDYHSIEATPFDLQYSVVPFKVRVLNKRQIGITLRVTDNRGLDHPLKSSAFQEIYVNSKGISTWQLGWQTETNPKSSITTLHGFPSYFKINQFSQIKALDHRFFKFNRSANRIEIHPFNSKTILQGNLSSDSSSRTKFIQMVGEKLLDGNGLQPHSGYQIIWKSQPSQKLVSTLAGTKSSKPSQPNETRLVLKDLPWNTESRQLVKLARNKLLQHQQTLKKTLQPEGEQVKQPPVIFSKIDRAVYVNAAIIDRTKNSQNRTYHYKPSSLNITTEGFNPSERKNADIPEIMGFLDGFETETGLNVLIVDTHQLLLNNKPIKFFTKIKTPDGKNHDVYAALSLEKSDQELISYWENNETDSAWIQLDKKFNKPFTDNNFEAVVTLANEVFEKEQLTDNTPLPVIADWVYLTAQSFGKLGQVIDAEVWYRKLIKDYPYSDHYADAWMKMTELHLKGIFKTD